MPRRNKRDKVYNIRFGTHSVVKKATVIAIDFEHARRKAKAFPDVKNVYKAHNDYERIVNREFINRTTELMKDIAQPRMTPLAMDEFIWKRRKRIGNKAKDRLTDG